MPVASHLTRLAWTARYLKAGQITARVRRRVGLCLKRDHGNGHTVPRYAGCLWPRDIRFLAPGVQSNSACRVRKGDLCFLNRPEKIGFPPKWDRPNLPRLWQYNLHYFEWLWPLAYPNAKIVVLDWIERCCGPRGAVGWEPYPTSLRLMNWCAVFFGRYRIQTESDRAFLGKLWASIVRQARHLAAHQEMHLLGNHYFENGAALALVGSCFDGPEAADWLDCGCEILRSQIPEQILPGGIHFELSPMYDCRVLFVLATLAATRNEKLKELVEEPAGRMASALRTLCHPDGRISLLSDSAFGVYNEPDQLIAFSRELSAKGQGVPSDPSGCFASVDAGYYGWSDAIGNYLICDFGKIGPDYIPGHAHADMFSFELSLRGHRVIVDSGVYDYEVSQTRRYCRSTAAHNTVEVNGQDQCQMWGAFRVARRGYPKDVQWQPRDGGFSLSGRHNGYCRLRGKPEHSRVIEWDRGGQLTIDDRITASVPVRAASRLHLHPTCRARLVRPNEVHIDFPAGAVRVTSMNGCSIRLEDGWYFPEFGVKEGIKVILFEGTGTDIRLGYRLGLIV